VRINFSDIEQKVEQVLRGWETAAPEQSFGDMTLEQFKQALQPFFATKTAFATISTQWDSAQQGRADTYPKALELATGVAASVKGPSQVRCEQRRVRGDGLHDEERAKLGTDATAGCRNAEGTGLRRAEEP
jgi:hypothetical protein